MDRLAILLVDDQKLFVDNLRIVLESRTKDLKVVGIAEDGRQAVEKADALRPAMVLMDVRMPGMDGVEATRLILGKHPDVRIVMLTTFDDDQYVEQALRYGAVGYILKTVSPAELISSIRAVRDGAVLISPAVAEKLVRRDHGRSGAAPLPGLSEARKLVGGLTPREREIVGLIALAYDNRQIAHKLGIAEQTVKNAIGTVFMKLGVSRRTQLMRLVEDLRKKGLFDSEH